MITSEFLHVLVTSYFILTLGATSLAKLKNWRVTSVGVLREGLFSARYTSLVVIAVTGAEFVLATLLMLDIRPVATALSTAGIFICFGLYRMAVAARTNSLMCSCAGAIRNDPASPPAVVGAVLSCLVQASLAGTLTFFAKSDIGNLGRSILVASWLAPVIAFTISSSRRSNGSTLNEWYSAELRSLH